MQNTSSSQLNSNRNQASTSSLSNVNKLQKGFFSQLSASSSMKNQITNAQRNKNMNSSRTRLVTNHDSQFTPTNGSQTARQQANCAHFSLNLNDLKNRLEEQNQSHSVMHSHRTEARPSVHGTGPNMPPQTSRREHGSRSPLNLVGGRSVNRTKPITPN